MSCCPICEGQMPNEGKWSADNNEGALSRYDNETYVCSNCGVAEAFVTLALADKPEGPQGFTWPRWSSVVKSVKKGMPEMVETEERWGA